MTAEPEWTFRYAPKPGQALGVIGTIRQVAEDEFFPEDSDVVALPADPLTTPVVRLRIELENGRPVCSSFTFERAELVDGPKGPEVSTTTIGAINATALIDTACKWLSEHAKGIVHTNRVMAGAGYTVDENGRFSFWTDEDERTAGEVVLARRRQRVDDDFLRRVAEVYLAADRAPTEAVREEFNTPKRNATRWVSMARERGFLPEYVRVKKEN